tara:strand:- start:620 stop:1480 length:861 start_codon:yes stop_codon:yes gene_type:complete
MMKELAGATIIVTGASSGIGAATAVACGAKGMNVVLGGRRSDRLEQVARKVESVGGTTSIVIGDVRDRTNTANLLNDAVDVFGGVDFVFANAGYSMERSFVTMSEDEIRSMFETNFFASVALVKEAALRWIESDRGGHVILCSSCVSKFPLPFQGVYAATKGAQALVARAMRHELAPFGIRVSTVHPVTTRTEFFDRSAERSGFRRGAYGREGVPDHAPRLFVQSPERVANAVVRGLQTAPSEIWTSWIVRMASALFTLFPRLQDLVMHRQAAAERGRHRIRRSDG